MIFKGVGAKINDLGFKTHHKHPTLTKPTQQVSIADMVLANIWKPGVEIGFIDFCVSKVWYKVHATNDVNPIYLQILNFFRPVTALCVLLK